MKTKTQVTLTAPKTKARQCADLLNDVGGDREAMRQVWDALDEPAREQILSYFAEWDVAFCEALNPAV